MLLEPERETPVVEESDVVVVGGGPAGLAAAVAASRNGVDTLLIERYGHLGGMATGGLVISLLPFRDGKRELVGGIAREIVGRLEVEGWAVWVNDRYGVVNVDPEGMKHLANVMLAESGARVLMHSLAVGAVVERNVARGVIIESKAGRHAVLAKVIVDASGDCDIAVSAGAPFEENVHPWGISLDHRIGGVDLEKMSTFRREKPDRWEKLRGEMKRHGFVLGWGKTNIEDVVWCNGPSFQGMNALDPKALTYIEIEARKRIVDAIGFYRRNLPGFERAYLLDTACQIGVRETRRIVGEYVMTKEDIDESRSFDDAVMVLGWVAGWQLNGEEPWIPFSLPYRCLVPKKVENLLVAGRCISCTHDALDALRSIPYCMVMGQAAGTAAALAAKTETPLRKLEPEAVQKTLKEQGVVLGQADYDSEQ